MPRKARISLLGEVHHVVSHGTHGLLLFSCDDDKKHFLKILDKVLPESKCECYGYAIMDTHFHLILRPLDTPMATIMRRINTAYARYYNCRYKRKGYVFQDRYFSVVAQEYWYLRSLIMYVNLNPLRANMVRCAAELANFAWSAHTFFADKKCAENKPSWLNLDYALGRFGETESSARKEYMRCVLEAAPRSKDKWESLLSHLPNHDYGPKNGHEDKEINSDNCNYNNENAEDLTKEKRICGTPEYIRKILMESRIGKPLREKAITNRKPLSELFDTFCNEKGVTKLRLLKRGRHSSPISLIRAEFCKTAREIHGYTCVDVTHFLSVSPATVVRLTRRAPPSSLPISITIENSAN
ncbi:MAG: transposase [Chitinispirillales bacterium]|jgi:REP element-mobilizing transposase RayT|nr:transposase [Chitinispirillales bacterium]